MLWQWGNRFTLSLACCYVPHYTGSNLSYLHFLYEVLYVVVVVVNILLRIKRTILMIGHCTALAVIVTKTLAGKLSEPKQDKEAKLTTPHVVV